MGRSGRSSQRECPRIVRLKSDVLETYTTYMSYSTPRARAVSREFELRSCPAGKPDLLQRKKGTATGLPEDRAGAENRRSPQRSVLCFSLSGIFFRGVECV